MRFTAGYRKKLIRFKDLLGIFIFLIFIDVLIILHIVSIWRHGIGWEFDLLVIHLVRVLFFLGCFIYLNQKIGGCEILECVGVKVEEMEDEGLVIESILSEFPNFNVYRFKKYIEECVGVILRYLFKGEGDPSLIMTPRLLKYVKGSNVSVRFDRGGPLGIMLVGVSYEKFNTKIDVKIPVCLLGKNKKIRLMLEATLSKDNSAPEEICGIDECGICGGTVVIVDGEGRCGVCRSVMGENVRWTFSRLRMIP